MPTALITGISGFTGQYVADALARLGLQVFGLVQHPSARPDEIVCDLTDKEGLKREVRKLRPDWVIHLAAQSFVAHDDAESFYKVNLFGTLNLLEALAGCDATPSKVLIASSANVYGRPQQERVSEGLCPAPVNHYACSKLAMEHMADTWQDRLPLIITRPFNYTGPGQDERFLIPKIVGHFARREAQIELGNLDVSRDFSDVRDVTDAYIKLLQSGSSGDCVNICSGKATSLRSIVAMMSEIAGYEIEIKTNPKFVRENDIPVLAGDPGRLTQIIGERQLLPLEKTLDDMLKAI